MPKVDVVNMTGEQVEELELNEDIFGIEVNEDAVYAVVKNQLANKRQGTQSAKTRSEVRGGGRKPWRQKGTGRARHGSSRSPIWVGGGVTFAPKPRDYSYKTPKAIRRLALKSVLTSKVEMEELVVVDEIKIDEIKTKTVVDFLKDTNAAKKTLIVTKDVDRKLLKSARNIEGIKVATVNTINVYDLMNCDSLIVTKEAINEIEEVYA